MSAIGDIAEYDKKPQDDELDVTKLFHGVEFKKDAAADGPPYGQETHATIRHVAC